MPNAPSKPENSNSKFQRIEIQIRDIDLEYIKELLILYFHFKDSPTYPVFVKFDGSYKSTGEAKSQNFRIVEYDEKKDYSSELAAIGINPFPTQTVVFIQMFEEGDIEGWGKVKEITQEIISRMEELEFKIISVKPPEFSHNMLLILDESKVEPNNAPKSTYILPNDEKTLGDWKKAYEIIEGLDRSYIKEWEDGNVDSSKPKLEDYRDALIMEMGWERSERTIRRIKRAGEKGLLK